MTSICVTPCFERRIDYAGNFVALDHRNKSCLRADRCIKTLPEKANTADALSEESLG